MSAFITDVKDQIVGYVRSIVLNRASLDGVESSSSKYRTRDYGDSEVSPMKRLMALVSSKRRKCRPPSKFKLCGSNSQQLYQNLSETKRRRRLRRKIREIEKEIYEVDGKLKTRKALSWKTLCQGESDNDNDDDEDTGTDAVDYNKGDDKDMDRIKSGVKEVVKKSKKNDHEKERGMKRDRKNTRGEENVQEIQRLNDGKDGARTLLVFRDGCRVNLCDRFQEQDQIVKTERIVDDNGVESVLTTTTTEKLVGRPGKPRIRVTNILQERASGECNRFIVIRKEVKDDISLFR